MTKKCLFMTNFSSGIKEGQNLNLKEQGRIGFNFPTVPSKQTEFWEFPLAEK